MSTIIQYQMHSKQVEILSMNIDLPVQHNYLKHIQIQSNREGRYLMIILHISSQKQMLWVFIRIALPKQSYWIPTTYVSMEVITHNICFYGSRAEDKYPLIIIKYPPCHFLCRTIYMYLCMRLLFLNISAASRQNQQNGMCAQQRLGSA